MGLAREATTAAQIDIWRSAASETQNLEFKVPIPTDRFIDGCQSRNEHLALVMRRLKICEEKGSGIDRVVKSAEIAGTRFSHWISMHNDRDLRSQGVRGYEPR
jgi:hypothetical protein